MRRRTMGSEHVCGLLRRISWRSLCDQPQEMIVAAGYLAYASLVIVLQLRGMTPTGSDSIMPSSVLRSEHLSILFRLDSLPLPLASDVLAGTDMYWQTLFVHS